MTINNCFSPHNYQICEDFRFRSVFIKLVTCIYTITLTQRDNNPFDKSLKKEKQ